MFSIKFNVEIAINDPSSLSKPGADTSYTFQKKMISIRTNTCLLENPILGREITVGFGTQEMLQRSGT